MVKEPPELERKIGLEVYVSKCNGIGGKLKNSAEDFLVEEITPEGKILEINAKRNSEKIPEEKKEYIHFTLQKRNWDTMRAIKELSKRLRVSRKRFGFAGTKDKRAITTQRISLWNQNIENLLKIKIKDIEILNPCYAEERINLGDLWGNRFTITLNEVNLKKDEIKKRIESILKELNSKVPGFFGIQRFGVVRPITHLVGREILKRNFKEAVMLYLAKDFPYENEKDKEARKVLSETENFREALKIFPKNLGYENSMLNHLVNFPNDFIGALRKLPKNLRLMFIHAYQAYLFNKTLSRYIKNNEESNNLKKIPITLPLVGYESEIDDITKEVMIKEEISKEEFKIKEIPELSSKGALRETFFEIKDFKFSVEPNKRVFIQFSLLKGTYATVLLREIMKNEYWLN